MSNAYIQFYCKRKKEHVFLYSLTGICSRHHLCDIHDCERKPGGMSDE